jgi:hypothetical protein
VSIASIVSILAKVVRVLTRAKSVLEREIMAQKEQQSQKNTKKAPAKSLKRSVPTSRPRPLTRSRKGKVSL